MTSEEKATALLKEFGALISIGQLSFNEDQNCPLIYNDNIYLSISFDPESDTMVLSAYVAHYPQHNIETVLKTVLEANYFWLGTMGATLAIDSESGRLALMSRIQLDNLDVSTFHMNIQTFVESVEAWMEMISTTETDTSALLSPQNDRQLARNTTQMNLRDHV